MTRLLVCVALFVALLPSGVLAHPLGNFTVNRYAGVEVAPGEVRVRYVVDMAEIPTFQERGALESGLEAYRDARAAELARGLQLTVDGRPLPLSPRAAHLELPPGQADLPTLRLTLDLVAPLDVTIGELHLLDANFPGRIGWREMTVRAADGARVDGSTVPSESSSDELRRYPEDLLGQPLDVGEARTSFRVFGAPGSVGPPAEIASLARSVASGELGTAPTSLALLLALLWGAMHALSPGHGKTIVAAYLVGSRGTARHALYLGLTVTATHTLGIYALGLVTLFASSYRLPERLYPWLSLASGGAVVLVGAALLHGRVRVLLHALAHARGAEHQHAPGRGHDHHHEHGPGGHTHDPPERLSTRGLIALGIAGGILPCPSALVLMLGAIAVGQVAFGLLLVVTFSLGLAGVLSAIGILLVCARRLIDRPRPGLRLPGAALLRWAPLASALVVTLAGAAMSIQAVAQLTV